MCVFKPIRKPRAETIAVHSHENAKTMAETRLPGIQGCQAPANGDVEKMLKFNNWMLGYDDFTEASLRLCVLLPPTHVPSQANAVLDKDYGPVGP